MWKDIKDCDLYQRMRNCTEVLAGKLIANKMLEKP